jgi:hypothetical protein
MLLNSQVETFDQKAVSRSVVSAPAREDDRAGRGSCLHDRAFLAR